MPRGLPSRTPGRRGRELLLQVRLELFKLELHTLLGLALHNSLNAAFTKVLTMHDP